jgi:hypothetical protein
MYNIFETIEARPLKVREGKRAHWIKTNGQRINLASRNHHSSLTNGRTFIFSEDRQQVKQLKNYI